MNMHVKSKFQHFAGQNTHCIVTNAMTIRVKNYVTSLKHNVVRPSWMVACTRNSRLLPWGPLDVIYVQDKDKENMKDQFDEFGDSYMELLDEHTLKRVMDNMNKEVSSRVQCSCEF